VQAKKAKPKIDNYPSVAYSNNNGLQIDLFMESAKNDSAFLLYMFYSSSEYDNYEAKRNFPFVELDEMIDGCRKCKNRAYFSPASMVYDTVFTHQKKLLLRRHFYVYH